MLWYKARKVPGSLRTQTISHIQYTMNSVATNAFKRMRGGVTIAARPKLGNVQIRETPDADSNTQLQLFRVLIGIDTPLNLTHNGDPIHKEETDSSLPPSVTSRVRGKNLGLYQRAKDQERRSRIAYLFTSYIGNTMFLVQIILAAAFTGLSAYKDAHAVTLTTLGALNTVVAGYVDPLSPFCIKPNNAS